MAYYILITLSIIVLIAYLFEISGKYSRLPGVILLLALGIFSKQFTTQVGLTIPDLSFLLPLMGTLGLILIVLEGSMDLSLGREKKNLVIKSFLSAAILFAINIFVFALLQNIIFKTSLKLALLNAIPLSIISSAVAIPSSINLNKTEKEFIVYESSLSDIIGILVFDFILFNQFPIGKGLFLFTGEIITTILFAILISAALAYILHKITHHVKYVIIIAFVVLIYTMAKIIHWPSLIVILIFGLILNNSRLFQIKPISTYIDFNEFEQNLHGFKQITGELTFLVRSFFFLIFGYYTSLNDLLNMHNLVISSAICISIFIIRAIFIKYALNRPLNPLLYFAPRGLITILLFLSIPIQMRLPILNEGVITQTIFISILFMTFGNMLSSEKKNK